MNFKIRSRQNIHQGRKVLGLLNSVLWNSIFLVRTKEIIYNTIVEKILIF